jgi:hypothetical protein
VRVKAQCRRITSTSLSLAVVLDSRPSILSLPAQRHRNQSPASPVVAECPTCSLRREAIGACQGAKSRISVSFDLLMHKRLIRFGR